MKTSRFFAILSLFIGAIFAVWLFFSPNHTDKTQDVVPSQKLKVTPRAISVGTDRSGQVPRENVVGSEPVPCSYRPGGTKSFFKEIGFLAGFAEGDLKDKQDYQVVPVIMRFGIDLKPAVKHSNPKDLFEFLVEPFAGFVASPDTNAEAGINLLVKYGRFITEKLCLYIEGGTGFIYLTQHTREQATQFNFADYAGGGIHYFLKDNLAVNVGYRFRHISNGSVKSPNKGIDSNMALAGISWFY